MQGSLWLVGCVWPWTLLVVNVGKLELCKSIKWEQQVSGWQVFCLEDRRTKEVFGLYCTLLISFPGQSCIKMIADHKYYCSAHDKEVFTHSSSLLKRYTFYLLLSVTKWSVPLKDTFSRHCLPSRYSEWAQELCGRQLVIQCQVYWGGWTGAEEKVSWWSAGEKRHGDIPDNFWQRCKTEDGCRLEEPLLKTLGQRKELWGTWCLLVFLLGSRRRRLGSVSLIKAEYCFLYLLEM